MSGPYATAAETYWGAGWRGILPLPARAKKHPPKGYTGQDGRAPSFPDIFTWSEGPQGEGNIALRMPAHVIGIDVDDYGDKHGGETLSLAEAAHGELPPTWRTTSRDDGVSGIRLYRIPEGLAWPGEIGPSIELIRVDHRYAVVWPSVHPEGRTYRWISPDGLTSTTVPDPDQLPLLPESWVAAYTGGALATHTPRVAVQHSDAIAWIAGRDHATATMCTRMERALEQHAADLPGSAHNSTRDAVLRVARLAEEGHHGSVHALAEVRRRFLADATSPNRAILGTHRRSQSDAVYEFGDLVASGVGVVLGAPSGLVTCDCFGQLAAWTTAATPPPPGTPPAASPPIDGTSALDPAPEALPTTSTAPDAVSTDTPVAQRFKDGATFILDTPEALPNIWGHGDDCLWAQGEALMICGPPGVGKTTLCGQVVRGLIGLQDEVLGLPVRTAAKRVLYLAMDRPAQIARGLRRAFDESDREVLAERLRFWEGPPPGDVAKHPTVLLSLAELAEADVIVIDSVKDAAIGLTEDEVGAAYNRARQNCLAHGVEVLELHHMVKRGANGAKPKELADVYGSAWLTAGAGSVLLLWGAAGDPIVEALHLKQPAGEVGPMKLQHDHQNGTTSIFHGTDVLATVLAAGRAGVGPVDVARVMFDSAKPSDSDIEKARRKLNKLVDANLAERFEEREGPWVGGPSRTRYRAPTNHPRTTHADIAGEGAHGAPRTPTRDHVSAGQTTHATTHATHASRPPTDAPSSVEEGGRRHPVGEPADDQEEEKNLGSVGPAVLVSCKSCFAPTPQVIANTWDGRCSKCAAEAGLT